MASSTVVCVIRFPDEVKQHPPSQMLIHKSMSGDKAERKSAKTAASPFVEEIRIGTASQASERVGEAGPPPSPGAEMSRCPHLL